jgi:hypothetical protein
LINLIITTFQNTPNFFLNNYCIISVVVEVVVDVADEDVVAAVDVVA